MQYTNINRFSKDKKKPQCFQSDFALIDSNLIVIERKTIKFNYFLLII